MKKKVIIVEDEIIFATDLKRIIENYGYDVPHLFFSGEELINKFEEIKPDLVIMDIKLKGKLDGIDTAKIIKQSYDVPMIYLTAFSDTQTFDKAKITKPYGFLIKPFNSRELHSAIEITLYNYEIERKIKENELLFDSILKSVKEGIILFSDKWKIKFANKSFFLINGYEENDIVNSNIEPDFNIIDILYHKKIDIKNLSINKNNFECILLTKNNNEIPIEVNINPIVNEKNNIVSYLIVIRDISERKNLEKEILEISEIERRDIGSYLHDDIGQHLTGVALLCKALQKKMISKTMDEFEEATKIIKYVNDATLKIKNLSRGLLPVCVEPSNFRHSLEELCLNIENLFNISCILVFEKKIVIYDNLIATNLYYIVKESVNNSIKHGNPKNIIVSVLNENNKLILTVEDDGVGLKKNYWDNGLGIGIMRYRAKVIGADLQILNNKSKGTKIVCEFL